MTASRPVRFVAAMTNVPDADDDQFTPGAFGGSLAERQPRIVTGGDWSAPIGRVVDLVELRPDDPALPRRTPDGRPWPRRAGALVGSAIYNLAVKGGVDAFDAARRGRGPHALALGFRAVRTRHEGGTRRIDEAQAWTLSPTAARLAVKGAPSMFETKAAPGARGSRPPWERDDDDRGAPPRRTRSVEPGKIDPDELDELDDVNDELSLSMSPPGMATLKCGLCAREFGWSDAPSNLAVCEDCARRSSQARARRGSGEGTAGRGGDESSAALRSKFPRQPGRGAPGDDAAGDPSYRPRPDGQLDREAESRRTSSRHVLSSAPQPTPSPSRSRGRSLPPPTRRRA